MSDSLQIRVYEKQHLVYQTGGAGRARGGGRQQKGEDAPYSLKREGDGWRVVIARVEENTISRQHLRAELLAGKTLRLTNLRSKQPLLLEDNSELEPQGVRELPLPYVLPLGRKVLRFEGAASDSLVLQSLRESTRPPVSLVESSSQLGTRLLPPAAAVEKDSVFQWLHAAMEVLHCASSSSDFFQQAAQAAVDMVGLDSCRVLLFDKGEWKTEAIKTGPQAAVEPDWQPSRQVLGRVRQEKKTFWQLPQQYAGPDAPSLVGVRTVVAAPILNPQGEVIGTLYGERRLGGTSGFLPPITQLEALLVELLACGVAAGLARVEQEKAALTARVQFEQFFTPELSRQLAANRDMLKVQDVEVTVLFCDVRGFSRITGRLGPAKTIEWISKVMGALSDCVQAQGGVLVDYIGDELMAMWGAPEKQPDHAEFACRAALHMLEELPELNKRWQALIGEPVSLRIGINSGSAGVGNVGTHRKFKYGPLGNTVNLASRVQGATKYLKANLLITDMTHTRLDPSFERRRLAQVRVINIKDPVNLYELVAEPPPGWPVLKERYEQALAQFETKQFRNALKTLGNLLVEFPGDGPSLVLLVRVVNYLDDDPAEFDPVWDLPGK